MSELDQPTYAPTPGDVQRIAVNATGGIDALEEALAQLGWVRLFAKGADVDVLFGDDSTPAITAQNGVSGGSNVVGYTVAAGSYHDIYKSQNYTHVRWKASGTGTLTIAWAGRRRGGK